MRRMNYLHGLLDGETTDHDERGVVRTRTLFKAGRRDGPMTEYDGNGNPISRTMFSADRQVGEKQSLHGNAPRQWRPWYHRLTGGRD
jgi:antitoxin component YwqK of YwqJK toxin-antitoxin module